MIRSSMIAASFSLALVAAPARADEPTPPLTFSQPQLVAPAPRVLQLKYRLLAQTTIIEHSPPPQTTIVTNTSSAAPSTAVEYQPRTGLIIGGLVTFGVAYATSVVAGSIKEDHCDQLKDPSDSYICRTQSWPVYVPLAGPFIQMGYVDGNGKNTVRTLLAIDGVVQVGGAVLALVGIAASNEPVKVTEVAILDHVYLTPLASREGTGVGAVGTF